MKYLFFFVVVIGSLTSCNSQPTTSHQAKGLAKEIMTIRPGTTATREGAWSMTARINGVKWTASSMISPEAAGRIVGYYKDDYIGLPYDKRNMIPGKKITFSENNATDLGTSDEIGLWGGRKGEMVITAVNGDWVEGSFYFTGTTSRSEKSMEVTDGFFRISTTDQP